MPLQYANRKKAKLRRARDAQKAWLDIFEGDESPRPLECHHGDRVATAHIRHFEAATEEVVEQLWGVNASTTDIVRNWDNFILGQLLDATHVSTKSKGGDPSSDPALQSADEPPCEVCLREIADLFVKNIKITKTSWGVTGSGASVQCDASGPNRRSGHERTRGLVADGADDSAATADLKLSKPLRIWALDTLDLRLYVTSSYIHLLRSSPSSLCENTPTSYNSLYLDFTPSEKSLFPPCSNPDQYLSVYTLLLDNDSRNLLASNNAGGSSLESEVLSFEVLKRIMPYWELSTMEMSTVYAGSGPITDFVARSHISPDQEFSVSVTRIFGWTSNMKISKSALTPLLVRKLAGLRRATERIVPKRPRAMVLFIWVPDGTVEKNVRRVWNKLRQKPDSSLPLRDPGDNFRKLYGATFELGVADNVIVFVAVCKQESWMDLRGWRRVFGKCDLS